MFRQFAAQWLKCFYGKQREVELLPAILSHIQNIDVSIMCFQLHHLLPNVLEISSVNKPKWESTCQKEAVFDRYTRCLDFLKR